MTILYGDLLIALGLVGYLMTDRVSLTALIPVLFGIPLNVLGVLAMRESLLKHAMHGAAMLGVLAFLGSAPALLHLPALLSGAELERPAKVAAQGAMCVLSLIFVALCVKSFIDTRRAREA
ncbi:MAG: hypothetical protein GY716_16735 [bacterium]|nr:hypothetical protein [bacterium]